MDCIAPWALTQRCICSGRWSAQGCQACTCAGPRRALRRSISSTALSPCWRASISRLVVAAAASTSGSVTSERRLKANTGAGSFCCARYSAIRRVTWRRSCAGWAVRTSISPVGATSRRLSRCQVSLSAQMPLWRPSSQACRLASRRSAPAISAGPWVTSALSSIFSSKCSGSTSHSWLSGALPRARSSASSSSAPKRRATPSRGRRSRSSQVRQPMRSSTPRCGRAAVRVCMGRSATRVRPCPGLPPAWRRRPSAIKEVAPCAYCKRARARFDSKNSVIRCASSCIRRASPPNRRRLPVTSSSTASSTSATRGVKPSARLATVRCSTASSISAGPGSVVMDVCNAIQQCMGLLPGYQSHTRLSRLQPGQQHTGFLAAAAHAFAAGRQQG